MPHAVRIISTRLRFLSLTMMLFVLLPAASVMAQVTPAPPAALPSGAAGIDPITGALPSFAELFATSPIINGLIAGLSILSVMLFVYFLVTINRNAMAPTGFVDEVNKLVLARRSEEAVRYCRDHRRVFSASILQRCLENAGKSQTVIMDVVQSEGQRRSDLLWSRINYLAEIAAVAPMLGLLGTVLGMMKAFFVLPNQAISVNSRALISAIGGAMTTTFFGLIVAILTVVFYTIIRSRATQALSEVEHAANTIADHVHSPPTVSTSASVMPDHDHAHESRSASGAGGSR